MQRQGVRVRIRLRKQGRERVSLLPSSSDDLEQLKMTQPELWEQLQMFEGRVQSFGASLDNFVDTAEEARRMATGPALGPVSSAPQGERKAT